MVHSLWLAAGQTADLPPHHVPPWPLEPTEAVLPACCYPSSRYANLRRGRRSTALLASLAPVWPLLGRRLTCVLHIAFEMP